MESLQFLNPNRSKKALTVLKFIIFIFILPWVYSFTASLINELRIVEKHLLGLFIYGIISFLILYLFIYEPTKIYQKGQKITQGTFRFISPLVKIAPFVLPIYSIIIFVIYYLISLFMKANSPVRLFMFLMGFTIIFHLVFSAKFLYSRKDDFLKINYFFSFSLIYIINIAILALGFSILFNSFSWLKFCKSSFQITKIIFSSIFTQLFL